MLIPWRWRNAMALFTNKQFAALAVVAAAGVWWMYRRADQLVTATGEAVSDSVWWYGHQIELAGDAVESIGMDAFDKKHRHVNKLMTDAHYLRWKNAVLTGQLPEPNY